LLDEEYTKLLEASNRDVHDVSKRTTLPIAREIVATYVREPIKAPWYIDLLNINLNNDSLEEARRRITLYLEAFRADGTSEVAPSESPLPITPITPAGGSSPTRPQAQWLAAGVSRRSPPRCRSRSSPRAPRTQRENEAARDPRSTSCSGLMLDVLPDRRFVMIRDADPRGDREIVLVQHFGEEANRLTGRR
jgi:hypothetical protein